MDRGACKGVHGGRHFPLPKFWTVLPSTSCAISAKRVRRWSCTDALPDLDLLLLTRVNAIKFYLELASNLFAYHPAFALPHTYVEDDMSFDELIRDVAKGISPEDVSAAKTAGVAVAEMYGDATTKNVQVVRPLVMQKHGGRSEPF